jgi:hypothetical protein
MKSRAGFEHFIRKLNQEGLSFSLSLIDKDLEELAKIIRVCSSGSGLNKIIYFPPELLAKCGLATGSARNECSKVECRNDAFTTYITSSEFLKTDISEFVVIRITKSIVHFGSGRELEIESK